MKGIQSDQIKISIISFDKKEAKIKTGSFIEEICAHAGIKWYSLPYKNKPVGISSILMLNHAWKLIVSLQKTENFDIVHGRGGIISVLGARMKKQYKTSFIYDMRGWWADEKLESGHWPFLIKKTAYYYFKYQEKQFFINSDYTVSLTNAGKHEIINNGWKKEDKIGVISTCTDLSLFSPLSEESKKELRKELNIPLTSKVLIYSGGLGGNYPIDKIFKFIEVFTSLSPEYFCIILSKDNINVTLPERTIIRSVTFREVNNYLSLGEIGFIYYKPAFSNIGRCPTKLGEYWACGLKVISPSNIGDLESIFKNYEDAGYCVPEWNEENIKSTLLLALKKVSDKGKLREAAEDYFALDKGIKFYRNLYLQLHNSDL